MSEPLALPVRADPDSEQYFAGLEMGELWLQRCVTCEQLQLPPRPFCGRCNSRSLSWERLTGHGSIYSLTVCYRAGTAEMSDRVPFVVGLVDLAEGVRIPALLELEPEQATIGLRVTARFRSEGNHTRLVFGPAERT